jgi:hypothetical protein
MMPWKGFFWTDGWEVSRCFFVKTALRCSSILTAYTEPFVYKNWARDILAKNKLGHHLFNFSSLFFLFLRPAWCPFV